MHADYLGRVNGLVVETDTCTYASCCHVGRITSNTEVGKFFWHRFGDKLLVSLLLQLLLSGDGVLGVRVYTALPEACMPASLLYTIALQSECPPIRSDVLQISQKDN